MILKAFLILVCGLAGARDLQTDVLKATAQVYPHLLSPGGQAELQIQLDLAPGFHAYSSRFKIKILEPGYLHVGAPRLTPEVEFFDVVSRSQKKGLQGEGVLSALLEVSDKAPIGNLEAHLQLTYQACTHEYCLLPKKLPLKVRLQVGDAAPQKLSTPQGAEISSLFQRGWLATFVFVFFMGVLTSFTPCIYPMIPITLAIIGSRKASRLQGFALSAVYVLGLALTYALIGVVVAETGALFGSVMSSPWVVGSIAVVFFVMALSMYGLFELQAPAFLRDRIGSYQTNAGFAGAFLSGLIAGVVASPCVGPVLVAILAYIAQTQDAVLGFFLLFTFALGMGVLLMVVGSFGQLLNQLPRSGPWMEFVKFIFGTTMLGASLYYASQVLPRNISLMLIGLSCILLASFFGAFQKPSTPFLRIKKGLMLAVLCGGVYLLIAGLDERVLRSPLPTAPVQNQALKWEAFSEEKLKAAHAAQKPVVLDFSAEWCAACHELEEKTYTDARVQRVSEPFVLLKVDATEATDEILQITKKHGVMGLPTLLFFNRKGELQTKLTLAGFEEPHLFAERLEKALD